MRLITQMQRVTLSPQSDRVEHVDFLTLTCDSCLTNQSSSRTKCGNFRVNRLVPAV